MIYARVMHCLMFLVHIHQMLSFELSINDVDLFVKILICLAGVFIVVDTLMLDITCLLLLKSIMSSSVCRFWHTCYYLQRSIADTCNST